MVGPPTRSGKLLPRDLTSRGAHNRAGGTDHDQGSHLGRSGCARRGDGGVRGRRAVGRAERAPAGGENERIDGVLRPTARAGPRSEEHTSELQSRRDLVCRLLLEKKKKLPLRSPPYPKRLSTI